METKMVELSSSAQAELTWKIENISKLNDDEVTISDTFNVAGYKWKVFISPKERGALLSLLLVAFDPIKLPHVEHRFTILSRMDRNNEVRNEMVYKIVLHNGDQGWSSCIRLRDNDSPDKGYINIMDDTCLLKIKICVG
ncbi:hypothetical protein C5167_001043 [Papaver somniferum]|uniref:MATH domain-containing protein n=1 Tax=Papaver somniferum TaxID=3469 RepID=A0A4Y7KR78_PAPSO|nr:uncharacterized protein LOC113308764 [Papaver somniferum]RZC75844.1 hypothetical protein C5167_001043 [Papaver somniferum]